MSKKTKGRKVKSEVIWIFVLVVCLVLVLTCILYFRSDQLKGTWSLDGTTVFEFNGKGKGTMRLPNAEYEFKYKVNDANKTVSIDYLDEKAVDYSYSFRVDEFNLTLYGNVDDETFEYRFTKQ